MAGTILLFSTTQFINRANDRAQLQITFTNNAGSTADTYTFAEKGIRVAKWGQLEWSYDFEDAFLVPGLYRLKLWDKQGYLTDLFFGPTKTQVVKTAKVVLYLNGVEKYRGYIQEDSIHANLDEKSVEFTCDPNTMILNQTELFDSSGNPVNQFGLSRYSYYHIPALLQYMYRLVDASITYPTSLEVYHDWTFSGERNSPVHDNHPETGIEFTKLYQMSDPLFFDASKGLNTMGDVLRKLAVDWCCFTGLIHSGRAFFKKLFYYDASNTQTLGTVLSRGFAYKYGLIDYVEITTDIASNRTWTQGTNTHITDRKLVRDCLPGFYDQYPYNPNSGTNIQAVLTGAYAGTYDVFGVFDPILSPSVRRDFGELVSMFWFANRNNLQKARVDRIIVQGIDYDFLKDFSDQGRKYQPIGMSIDLGANETSIDALYLGEL